MNAIGHSLGSPSSQQRCRRCSNPTTIMASSMNVNGSGTSVTLSIPSLSSPGPPLWAASIRRRRKVTLARRSGHEPVTDQWFGLIGTEKVCQEKEK